MWMDLASNYVNIKMYFAQQSERQSRLSRIYDVSRCKQHSGSLLELILGAKGFAKTGAMQRGKRLEHDVVDAVETRLGIKIHSCGLTIEKSNPVLAASPDGLLGAK